MSSPKDKFLEFYNQELDDAAQSDFQKVLSEDKVVRQEFEDFVSALEMSKSVGEEEYSLPDDFNKKMLAELRKSELVLEGSFMKKFFGSVWRLFRLPLLVSSVLFMGLSLIHI